MSQYTDEQIIETLELRMSHDKLCCEAYELIKRLKSERTELLRSLKCEIHEKAVYPGRIGVYPFIRLKVFDAILQTYANKYKE